MNERRCRGSRVSSDKEQENSLDREFRSEKCERRQGV